MKFYGELLIYVLLLLTNLRVFFVKHVRRDQLVSLSPFTLLISILQIIAWGIDLFTFLALIISILVFLSNFHALFRYTERLYVDHYSPLMKIWASFTVTISAAAIAGILIFAPVEIKSEKMNISETSQRYTGNFRTGFEEASLISKTNLILYKFTPEQKPGSYTPIKGLVLFIPDKRGETVKYKPYLQLLAKEGYTIYSADFYADDGKWIHNWQDSRLCRRIFMTYYGLSDNQKFMSQREFYTYNYKQELKILSSIMEKECGYWQKYYLISDVLANTALEDYVKENPAKVAGIFNLDSISEYKSAGYGCIEQTDPITARQFNLTRDPEMFTPKLLVLRTKECLLEKK